ncbi:hypothetical protein A2U01_0094756, partial [Trifolium medium]|nr:hypothetical protein [Trifolium medium]
WKHSRWSERNKDWINQRVDQSAELEPTKHGGISENRSVG